MHISPRAGEVVIASVSEAVRVREPLRDLSGGVEAQALQTIPDAQAVEAPPDPDLLPACGEKEKSVCVIITLWLAGLFRARRRLCSLVARLPAGCGP